MFLLLGILGFTVSFAALWFSLPKNGRTRPFVNTVWEPYVAIALTIAFTLSVVAIAIGIADLFL